MLTADMLGLLALLGAVSALDPSLTFHYVKYPRMFRRNEAACQICYGEFDCLSMECGYNAAVTAVLKEDDGMNIVNDALAAKVDSMMYDLVLEDSMKEYNECVPLISSYTTCNKDNICLGCKTCDCDERGRWNCTDTHKCSTALLNVDHEVFNSVAEQLKSASRYKRSYEVFETSSTRNFFEEIADWVSEPMKAETVKYTEHSTTIVPTTKSLRSFSDENTNLAFDDILNNDNLDHWIKSSEKYNTDNKHENTDSRNFLQILRNIEEGNDDTVHIDNPARNIQLLKDLKKYLKDNSNGNESVNSSNDQPNSINAIITDTDDFDFEKQPSYMNSVATVVKRNVKDINETFTRNETIVRNETSTFKNETEKHTHHRKSNSSDLYPEIELQHLVDVINMLIKNEHKEINHLNYVKDNLQKFLRKYRDYSNLTDVLHEKHKFSDNYSTKHDHLKVDMLNFYINNLKKDVKDTIRDIYAIQKLKNVGIAPITGCIKKLKPLLFALTSYYLNSSRNQPTKKYSNLSSPSTLINSSENQTTDLEPNPQRRLFEPSNNVYKIKLIKRALTRMLIMIDNGTPSKSILSPLPPRTKNILNRIVVKLHKPQVYPSIRDPNFNLTEILTTLAQDWQNVPVAVHKLNPADRLRNMKLLHLIVSQGIDKLKDALISIQFGYSRRMNFIEERVGKDLVSDASKYLSTIDNRIKGFVISAEISKVTPNIKNKEKKSMWHHIKNAFSNSKAGLIKYFHNQFPKPKSFIVNYMVKKRLEEVNRQKFLEVMKRWQENFDSYQGRQKRSLIHYEKRMKNIIPKYLREIKRNNKVNPQLHATVTKYSKTENNKVHADQNKNAETNKDKMHFDGNNYSETKKDKVIHASQNKYAETKKDKIHFDENNYSVTRKNKVIHAYQNKYAETKKDKIHFDGNHYSETRNVKVHATGLNENTGKRKAHSDRKKDAGIKNNNWLHVEKNVDKKKTKARLKNKVNPTLHANRNDSKGNDKKLNGAILGNKTGYSTSKRGVRTQGYH